MASATAVGYGSIPGSRTGSRPQSPAVNASNGMDKSALRTSSPYSYGFDKDRSSFTSLHNSDKPISSSGAVDADYLNEKNGEPEIDSVSNYSGSRRGSFDFQAILKKYNIRLDEEEDQAASNGTKDDKRASNGAPSSALASRSQTPQFGDSTLQDSTGRKSTSQAPVSSFGTYNSKFDPSTTTSKFDSAGKLDSTAGKYDSAAKLDYASRTSATDADSAYNTPQIRAPLVPKRSTPVSFGSGTQPAASATTNSYSNPTGYGGSQTSYGGASSDLASAPLSSSIYTPAASASLPPPAPTTHEDGTAVRRQLAERDTECAVLRRQLEEERERVRRTQSELASARAAASTVQKSQQVDPALTAKSIELETMRERYEELLAEKTSLEDTVDRMRREAELSSVRATAAQPAAPRRRYDDESSSDEQDAPRSVPHLNLYDPNGPEALKRKISELESHVRDLQEANEAAAHALQRREREIAELKQQRSGVTAPSSSAAASNSSNASSAVVDQLKREVESLRERNRSLVEESSTLRDQLLAAKKTAASSAASTNADSLRYYQTQLSDARETIRKLQDQVYAARSSPTHKQTESTAAAAGNPTLRASPYSSIAAPASASIPSSSSVPRSSSPSNYARVGGNTDNGYGLIGRSGLGAAVVESDADVDADADQSDSNSTNVLLNAASRVPYSLVDLGEKDVSIDHKSKSTSITKPTSMSATIGSGSNGTGQYDLTGSSKYDSLSLGRKYDRSVSPTRATASSTYLTQASSSSSANVPSPTASKGPSFATNTSADRESYSKRYDDYGSRITGDRDHYSSTTAAASKTTDTGDRGWLKTDYQSRSLRSSPVVVTSSWNGAATHAAGDSAMRSSAFDLHGSRYSTSTSSAANANTSSQSSSAFRSPYATGSSTIGTSNANASRIMLSGSTLKNNDSLLSDSDGEKAAKLSAATISANITRLLDKSSTMPQHISGRASVPVKATLPVALAAGTAEREKERGSAYNDLFSDNRRSRINNTDLQLGSRNSSTAAGQSKYSTFGTSLGERSVSTTGLEHRSAVDSRTSGSSYRSAAGAGIGVGAGIGSSDSGADRRSRPFAPRLPSDVRQGDSVKFCRQGGHVSKGRVMYVGPLPGRGDTYLGVELDNEDGKHDGIYEGSRYFKCKPNKGVFVAFSKVILVY